MGDTDVRPCYTFQGWAPAVNSKVSAVDADDKGEIVYTAVWQKAEDLIVTKTADQDSLTVGDTVKYTITVANDNSFAVTVTVTDPLSEKLDFGKVSESDGGVYDKDRHTVAWASVTVPANGSKQILLWAVVNEAGQIDNKAYVTWKTGEAHDDATVEASDPEDYDVTYKWSGLPDGAAVKVPGSSSHEAGETVDVDKTFVNGSTTIVNGVTYVFSGWDKTGSFEMPAENVVIFGSWTIRDSGNTPKPTPDPTPTPDPVPTPDPAPTPGTDSQPNIPSVDLNDPNVPLTDMSVKEPKEVKTSEDVEIPEADVPLANVPKTGDISALWYLTTLLSAGILATLGLRRKNRS